MRGWRNTGEIVLLEISNSMKPYLSVLHAYTSKLRPVTGFFEPKQIDEVSNRIPPTSRLRARKCRSAQYDAHSSMWINMLLCRVKGSQECIMVHRRMSM